MLRTLIIITGLFISTLLIAQESQIVASWVNADNTAHIRIFKATNGKYYGKIDVLLENPGKLDENNPDESKRQDPLEGLMLLKGFNYEADSKQWNSGTIYDPDNGKTYDCYMWFDDNPDALSIKGYVMGMKFVGRETQWTRVKG